MPTPRTIQRSDKHAREIYEKTLESAEQTYRGNEEAAHRVAYAALKHSYRKEGNRWVPKDEKGPSDPQAARGPTTRKKSTDPDRAPTARGKVARTAGEARRKAKEAAREDSRARRESRRGAGQMSRDELYQQARRLDIPGRSKMSKEELARAVAG